MKIDAHQHYWKYNQEEYGWIDVSMNILRKDYLPVDLKPVLQSAGFDGAISVQARQTKEETAWLLEMSEKHDIISGVVGWLDLQSESFEEELEKWANHPKLVGLRHVVHDEPDDNFMHREEFLRGISLLKKYNLTYDLLLFPRHLPLACKVVEMFPEQMFILDHIAKPLIKNGILEPWKKNIQKLAKFQNVSCKLSGMVTEANWKSWKLKDFTLYLDVVFECFGADRLMIGSDWPVCTLGGNYKNVIDIVSKYVSRFDKSVQEKIMGGNCSAIYSIQG